jgi:hypothetical protein
MFMKRAFFAAVLVVFVSLPTFAAHHLEAVFPVQKDSPIQIIGVLNTPHDMAGRIEVRNQSRTTIVDIQLGWVIEAPAGCSHTGMPPIIERGKIEEVSIEPGAKYSTFSYRIGTRKMLNLMHTGQTEYLYIQLGVVYVRFVDGSTWQFDLKKELSFDHNEFFDSRSCGPETEQAIKTEEDQLRSNVRCGQGKAFVISSSGEVQIVKDPDILNINRGLAADDPNYNFICTWICQQFTGYTCTRINNPKPGCEKDQFGACCITNLCEGGSCSDKDCYLSCVC